MVVSPSPRLVLEGRTLFVHFPSQARYRPSRRRWIFSSWTISASHKATIVDHLNLHLVDPRSSPRDPLSPEEQVSTEIDPSPTLNPIPLSTYMDGLEKDVTSNNVGRTWPGSLAIALHDILPILFPHYMYCRAKPLTYRYPPCALFVGWELDQSHIFSLKLPWIRRHASSSP
ncbi:hypothetical protein CGRA01v4_03195 [Colletotrichum graminicola]|nr:hypothetical protein CGRA01v4_03195 [Colletotrichum graminicola]